MGLKMDHQSQLAPADNKFHVGNGEDGISPASS
jgi:hypothetical protein